VREICAIISTVLVLSSMVAGQIPRAGNVFLGYSYLRGETFTASTTVRAAGGGTPMNGWEASAEGKYRPWLGAVVDFDWHYGGRDTTGCAASGACRTIRVNASRHVLLLGPRASLRLRRYVPFAEFLLGFAHQSDAGGGVSNSDLTFARAFGAGLDWELTPIVAWQTKVDSVHTSFFRTKENDLRISTGVVFRF
jgi:hypothetical protein